MKAKHLLCLAVIGGAAYWYLNKSKAAPLSGLGDDPWKRCDDAKKDIGASLALAAVLSGSARALAAQYSGRGAPVPDAEAVAQINNLNASADRMRKHAAAQQAWWNQNCPPRATSRQQVILSQGTVVARDRVSSGGPAWWVGQNN